MFTQLWKYLCMTLSLNALNEQDNVLPTKFFLI